MFVERVVEDTPGVLEASPLAAEIAIADAIKLLRIGNG